MVVVVVVVIGLRWSCIGSDGGGGGGGDVGGDRVEMVVYW